MNNPLESFIEHARLKGMDHGTIRTLLLSAGWKEKDVAKALIEQELDVPVPLPPDTGGAREAFFHLIAFGSLYAAFICLSILFFTYINRLFPDAAFEISTYQYDAQLSAIRWSMATVIVCFPILLFISRIITRDMRDHPERSVSGIRRWLTYVTLLVTAAAIAIDVVTFLYFLLEGEISIRFLLKVFVILLLAGAVFSYYFLSLKLHPGDKKSKKYNTIFSIVASSVTVLALIWGGVVVGSPARERDRKLDDTRVEHFQTIRSELYNIVYEGRQRDENPVRAEPIPRTLQELKEKAYYQEVTIVDPETSELYGYEVLDENRVDLCTNFSEPQERSYDIFWNHPAGYTCFTIDLTKPISRY